MLLSPALPTVAALADIKIKMNKYLRFIIQKIMNKLFLWNLFCKPFHPEPKDIKSDNWEEEWHNATVISCYDGDTITVKLCRNGVWIIQKIRMMGYDSPEMKPSKNKVNRDEEIKHAKIAKEKLEEKILNKRVILHCVGREKFGRILAYVHLPTLFSYEKKSVNQNKFGCTELHGSVNEWMMENGYGVSYEGGTKKEWEFSEN